MDCNKKELESLKSNFNLKDFKALNIKTFDKSKVFTALKDKKKVFIKYNSSAQNEYEKTKLLYELNNKNFIKPIGVMDKFILFEFVEGQTLSCYLKGGDRSKDKTIIAELENIAKTLMQTNIIHKDIHEGNIIITKDSVKLIDLEASVRLLKPEPSILGANSSYFDDMYSLNLIIDKLGGKSELIMNNIGRYKLHKPLVIHIKPHDVLEETKIYLCHMLGTAVIENSKSIWGYIKIPFILWNIKREIKILKKISNGLKTKPATLSYTKEFLGYKLGQALIKASNTWYKGSLFKYYFEAKKITKEHKKNLA